MRAPTYLRVADRLEAQLARLRAGAAVQSEHALAREYDVSRLTARAALEELERRYLVRRARGRGTFVASRIDYVVGPSAPHGFSEKVARAGAVPRVRTVSLRRRMAPAETARRLQIDTAASVWHLARVRYVDEVPAGYAISWFPHAMLPDLDERLGREASLGDVLSRSYGYDLAGSKQTAEFAIAPLAIARDVWPGERPMIVKLTALVHPRGVERPIEWTTSYLRADIFRVVLEFGAAS